MKHYSKGAEMIKFRSPIIIQKKEKAFVLFNCSHCGSHFFVAVKNIRVSNYCNSCQ